jgi:hypothetical protein
MKLTLSCLSGKLLLLLWSSLVLIGVYFCLTGSATAISLDLSDLPDIPQNLASSDWQVFNERLNSLRQEKASIKKDVKNFNKATAQPIPPNKVDFYQKWQASIEGNIKNYNEGVALLKRDLKQAPREPDPAITLSPAAADLVALMNDVSKKLNLPKGGRHEQQSKNCSSFFRGVGRELEARGLPATSEAWSPHLVANDIMDKIESNQSQQWKKVDEKQVQEMANQGFLVVGLSKGLPNGHVGIAFPIPPGLDPAKFSGTGPFVRDGNEHYLKHEKRLYATTWGAVEATKTFDYKNHPPKWYIWLPLDPSKR